MKGGYFMKIKMPRGDIRNIKFSINDASNEIVSIDFDEIYFTCKKTFNDSDILFQKKLTDGSITKGEDGFYHLTIKPVDTDNLKYGNYVFDIELILGDFIKQTTIGELMLTNEVTHAQNEV